MKCAFRTTVLAGCECGRLSLIFGLMIDLEVTIVEVQVHYSNTSQDSNEDYDLVQRD